jgi:hypothetical protein
MTERDHNKTEQQQSSSNDQQKKGSGAFNEPNRGDEKSTTNIEEETELEQQRKEAMSERD